jgi:hypothetical protein
MFVALQCHFMLAHALRCRVDMFKLPLLPLLIIVGLLLPVGAAAQTSEEDDKQRALAASLFDAVGAPLMRISGPIYLQLGVRDKLRGLGTGAGATGAGGGSAAGSSPSGTTAGPGTGADGGDTDADAGDGSDSDGGAIGIIPGGDQNGDDTGTPGDDIRDVPEPALLALIAPGVWLALRRRARRAQSFNA